MKTQSFALKGARIYMIFSILCLLSVSILSICSPQSTMNLVATPLPNNDAISSIRAIYGGVGMLICFTLYYLLRNDLLKGILFLVLFWWVYSLSRLITLMADGPLGSFGNKWMITEALLGMAGFLFFIRLRKLS